MPDPAARCVTHFNACCCRDALAEGLAEALGKLAAEVAALEIAEAQVRAAIGNTNWSVLMLRRDEARAALVAWKESR